MNLIESIILDELALCQQNLMQLEQSLAAADVRINPSVRHNLDFAKKSIEHAIEKCGDGDLKKAKMSADIALLRADFATRIYEAEMIETVLGESDFLEVYPAWLKDAEETLDRLALMLADADKMIEGG